ncbi:Histone-lysine N-methyltransferase SUV39H2 [Aix galericulata]|nr:Histone-lysine N-methyltransferase SUV39H2 [Aix galericulata]
MRPGTPSRAWYVPCLASLETLQELCRKENLRCKSIGITNRSLKSYEVEYLCDYKVEEGTEYYLVKWKGWPESSNTWEPQKNLKCPLLLQNFLSDKNEYLSRVKEGKALKVRNHVKALKPAVADYIVRKAKQRIALQRWKEELNRKKNHRGMILVENTVDLEGPPLDFYYINEYKPAPGINVINGITTGCECSDCPAEKCCPKEAGFILAYNKKKKLKIQPGLPIYECNSFCRCGPDCPNRIVQKGTQYSLCIFRTNNGRGWGVKTLQKIKTNSFVMEYVGEVITSEEAERRGQLYDNQGNTYLFDLDYDSDEFTVDAARYGNVSHFVNHSCDPNLQVFNVFIDNLDLRLPRIALFSTRTIKAGEELTFDYQMKGSIDLTSDSADGLSPSKKRIRTVCKCGAVSAVRSTWMESAISSCSACCRPQHFLSVQERPRQELDSLPDQSLWPLLCEATGRSDILFGYVYAQLDLKNHNPEGAVPLAPYLLSSLLFRADALSPFM